MKNEIANIFTNPVKVIGFVPVHSSENHWRHVTLCRGCLNVTGEVRNKVSKVSIVGEYVTWNWVGKVPNLLCFWRGHDNGVAICDPNKPHKKEFDGVHHVKGRYHSSFNLFWPPSWFASGWWEIRNFKDLMGKSNDA
jgi:hypothetical protein